MIMIEKKRRRKLSLHIWRQCIPSRPQCHGNPQSG